MIGFDSSLLLSAIQLRNPFAAGAGVETSAQRRLSAQKIAADRVAPWAAANRPADAAVAKRVKELLSGAALVPEAARKARPGDVADETQLFNAFQTLDGLRILAQRAAKTEGVTPEERYQLQARFASGMREAADHLAKLDLDRVVVAPAGKAEEVESAFALRRGKREYVTRAVHVGSLAAPVAAWTGDLRFTVVVRPGQPAERRLVISLAEMVAAPPTLDAMIGFINAKLEAEGLSTRFDKAQLPPDPNAKADAPPQWALKVKGFESEPIAFEGEAAGPAVFAVTARGAADARSGELVKLNAVGAPTRTFTEPLSADPLKDGLNQNNGLETRAAARGPDGSLYVVGDAAGPVGGSMGIEGARDVFLSKYDTAGRRLWTRPLGASESGQGFAVAVGADGTVAVAGAVRGRVEAASAGGLDAVVAAFDASGAEKWVRQLGSKADEEARAVAVGVDGSVVVAGRTRGGLAGQANAGGWDGFVTRFDAAGAQGSTRMLGGAGEDRADALAIAGDGAIVLGSTEGGVGVIRKLAVDLTDVWSTQTAPLGDGGLRAIAVDGADIVVTGSTTAQDLGLGGSMAAANSGRRDAFALKLTDGAAPTTEWTRFTGSALDDDAGGVTIAGGAVYLATTSQETPSDGSAPRARAMVEKLDLGTGAQDWRQAVSAQTSADAAVAVMVDPGAASTLDIFGLPSGQVTHEDAAPLVARTALRDGDHFFVKVGSGAARKIALRADDTMTTLVSRINGVLRSRGEAQARLTNEADKLVISAADGQKIELSRGANGQDALGVLGLSPGRLTNSPGEDGAAARQDAPPVVALNFRETLRFADAVTAQTAMREIEQVQRALRRAYGAIFADPNARPATPTGPVPAAIQAQLANYRAGLERLTGGGGGGLFG